MARHKDILKSHNPEMLFTFDEETNFITVVGNNSSGFYIDEHVYQNTASGNIYHINNDSYDTEFNTKTLIPNERFSTFTSFSFGKSDMTYNRADMFLEIENDPECMTSATGSFSTSFQLQFPDIANGILNTKINNEAFKRYQLLMVRVVDNFIMSRGEFTFDKNVISFNINPALLYNTALTDEVTGEVIPQNVEVAFVLVYDRLAYTDGKSKFRDNEWDNSNINTANAFYNDIVGSYLYLDPNPLHDNDDTSILATDIASWIKYNNERMTNLPQVKDGIRPYTHLWTIRPFQFIYNPNADANGIDNLPNVPKRVPDFEFDSWYIHVKDMVSIATGRTQNLNPPFEQHEYLSYTNDTQDVIKTWTDITKSNIRFTVSLNKIPHIVKFNYITPSTSSSIWYQLLNFNGFSVCGRPFDKGVSIAVVINGIVSSFSHSITNNKSQNFIVNYDRSNNDHKIEMYANGEYVGGQVIYEKDRQFNGQLIKENNNIIQFGTDGKSKPYLFTTNTSYSYVGYSSLPSSTWGIIVANQTETGWVNIFPNKVLLDNVAVFNNKLFTQDEARELFISTLTYSGILEHLAVSHHYKFQSLKHYYRYQYSNFTYTDGWVYKLIDSKTYNPNGGGSDTTSNDMYSDRTSLMYSGDVSIEKVDDHGVIEHALRMQNNAVLQTGNNLLYSTNNKPQTMILWFKTTSNKHQYILSAVDHALPFKGATVEIQSGYITFNFGSRGVTTPNTYADGQWHRLIIQFRPHASSTNKNGMIMFIVDQNFKTDWTLSSIGEYTHGDYTQYWSMTIGNDLIGDRGFDGYIAEIQMFDSFIHDYYLNYLYTNRQYFVTSGTIYFNNLPTNTKVRIYSHLTGELLAQVMTDYMGYFEYKNEETYTIDVVVLDNRNYMENYQTFTGIILNSK